MAFHALCIGINRYPGTGSDLRGCVNDATDWARELRRRGFQASTLLDRAATGAEIRRRIAHLVAAAASGDTVLVQFSGHGSFVPDRNGDEPDGRDECICPTDIRAGYITDDELFALFGTARRGVRTVMISDSCHSGTIARLEPSKTECAEAGQPASARRARFLPPATFLELPHVMTSSEAPRQTRRAPRRRGALTLSGCQDAEYSYDDYFDGRPNGAFTYVALQALSSLRRGATYRDWHTAIRMKLPSREHPQTPSLQGISSMTNTPIPWLRSTL